MHYKASKKPNLTIQFPTAVLILLFLVACGAKKDIVISRNNAAKEKNQIPQIVFLNYTLKKEMNGKKTVRLVSSKKVDGKLKNQYKNTLNTIISGDLICNQLDKSSVVLSQKRIKNPLKKSIEYIDGTDNFKIKQIELDSAQFFVRLQLLPKTSYISITESGSYQQPLILTKTSEL